MEWRAQGYRACRARERGFPCCEALRRACLERREIPTIEKKTERLVIAFPMRVLAAYSVDRRSGWGHQLPEGCSHQAQGRRSSTASARLGHQAARQERGEARLPPWLRYPQTSCCAFGAMLARVSTRGCAGDTHPSKAERDWFGPHIDQYVLSSMCCSLFDCRSTTQRIQAIPKIPVRSAVSVCAQGKREPSQYSSTDLVAAILRK